MMRIVRNRSVGIRNFKYLCICIPLFFYFEASARKNILLADQLTTKDGLPVNSVQSIHQDKYGYLWFGSFSSICKYNGYDFVQYFPEIDNPNTLVSPGIYNLAMDSVGGLWVGFFDTTYFCRYNYKFDYFERIQAKDVAKCVKNRIDRGRETVHQNFNKESGIWRFDNGQLYNYDSDGINLEGVYCLDYNINEEINQGRISRMYLSPSGLLWIGTENQGVFKINTQPKPFFTLYKKPLDCEPRFNDIIRAIYEDNDLGEIWLGTYANGIIRYNKTTGKENYYKYYGSRNTIILPNNQIRAIYKDSNGMIWLGTKGGVAIVNPENDSVKYYTRNTPNKIPDPWVHAITEDHEGLVWIGTFYGIVAYNRQEDRFVPIYPVNTLKNSKVSGIIEDSDENLWVATQGGGVTCLKRKTTPYKFDTLHYLNIPNNPNSLSSNRVFSLLEDKQGYIWMATDHGLNRLDKKTKQIKRIGIAEGLPDLMVMGMLLDGQGNVWCSHKKGISKIDKQTLRMQHFNVQDGLYSNDFQENAFFKNQTTGAFYFGNSKGLVKFFPDSITETMERPLVYISGLQVLNNQVHVGEEVMGKKILTKAAQFTDTITLEYQHKSFLINFTALQFNNQNNITYNYMLEGYDAEWITTDANQRFASYSNLRPGKYTFKVKAANGLGLWSESMAKMIVIVLSPWWLSVWAIIVYVFCLIALLYWVYSYLVSRERLKNQIRYEKMKADKVKQLEDLKLQFFTHISHEIRTPLSLLVDPIKKLKSGDVPENKVGYYYQLMNANAHKLLELVSHLLDFRKISSNANKLEKKKANISLFLSGIANTFNLNAVEKHVQFSFQSNPNDILALFDPEKLEKVIFNLMSNAFQFTAEGGKINFNLTYWEEEGKRDSDFLKISIEDNGIGINEEEHDKIFENFYQATKPKDFESKGSGIGLAIVREMTNLMGAMVFVKSIFGQGSEFVVKLPTGLKGEEIDIKGMDVVGVKSNLIGSENEIGIENSLESKKNLLLILIVEDNQDVREYLMNELLGNYRVVGAKNGEEGLDMVLEYMPDLVLSDILMPKMNGIDLCEKLKTDKRTSHIPVVLLSAKVAEESKLEGFESGADAYITKPFSVNVLNARIKSLIANRKRLQQSIGEEPFIEIKHIANNKPDEVFLTELIGFINQNISDVEFNVDYVCEKLNINRKQLSHKVKTIAGTTVKEFVKIVRLNKAAELLITTEMNVSEIAYKVGYNVPTNFSRSFHKQFGLSPSEYVKKNKF